MIKISGIRKLVKRELVAGLCGVCLLLAISPAAVAVVISPIQLDLSNKKPIGSFTVTNDTAFAITYQAKGLSWQQADGKDVQELSNEVIVSPPIVTIPSMSKQVFRLALQSKLNTRETEQAFRLVLEDVSAEVAVKKETGVSFRFNHNLPVYYAPAFVVNSLAWSACVTEVEGKSCLRLDNKGNQHLKIIEFKLSAKEATTPPKVILAGSSAEWLYATKTALEATENITVLTDRGPLSLSLATDLVSP